VNDPDQYGQTEDRRVTVGPHTLVSAWPLEHGETLVLTNASGRKIEVEAGTLSHGRNQRINELIAERDALRAVTDRVYARIAGLWITDARDDYQRALIDCLVVLIPSGADRRYQGESEVSE
jgi:hypothetical protein